VLAAPPEHQTHFRELSRNPFLATTGIELNPGAFTPAELPEAAWRAIEPLFEERLSTPAGRRTPLPRSRPRLIGPPGKQLPRQVH